ncbi:hypothetical protein LJR164_004490 [Phenylobacterium sp. LjRoot164]|uniref:hypothetical protein n=1 Tax=unclassified Phenylobacterium TaxID=2640670 RepID=UPI003ECEDB6E
MVEDDYFAALEIGATLRRAGAEIVGPCADTPSALACLDDTAPTCAVLDLDLGYGRLEFEVALELRRLQVPFLFHTAHPAGQFPADLRNTVLLPKPVPDHRLIAAVENLERRG